MILTRKPKSRPERLTGGKGDKMKRYELRRTTAEVRTADKHQISRGQANYYNVNKTGNGDSDLIATYEDKETALAELAKHRSGVCYTQGWGSNFYTFEEYHVEEIGHAGPEIIEFGPFDGEWVLKERYPACDNAACANYVDLDGEKVFGTVYSDDECFDSDGFYQFLATESGIYKVYYTVAEDQDLDDIDYTKPERFEKLPDDYFDQGL